jgi:hypothetical protein
MVVGASAFAIGIQLLQAKTEKKLREKHGESSEQRIDR